MTFIHSLLMQRWIKGIAIGFCTTIAVISLSMISPPVQAKSLGDIWSSVQRVFAPNGPKRNRAGGRGPEAIISPGVWVDRNAGEMMIPTVWNLQPVILYQRSGNRNENATALQLVDVKTRKVIQSFKLGDEPYSKLVINQPLKPGNIYAVSQLKDDSPMNSSVIFRIASGVVRQRLDASLQRLEKQGASTPIALSEEKIKLFVQNQLWSDALQELSQWVTNDDEWKEYTASTIEDWRKKETQTLVP